MTGGTRPVVPPLDDVSWPTDAPGTWQGCPREPLLQVLAGAFRAAPGHVPLIFDDGVQISNAEIEHHASRLARLLSEVIGLGDRVIISVGNRAEYVFADLAVLANRAVAIGLSPEVGSHEARFVVEDSGSVLAITDERSDPTFRALVSEGKLRAVLRVEGPEPHGLDAACQDLVPLDLSAVTASLDDIIDIGYTSGTTGLPKALGGNHESTLRYIDVTMRFRYRDLPPDFRVMYPLQFHYGDPLTALYTAIHGGFTVIVMRRFSATRFWQVAKALRATAIVTIGSIPTMLLSRPETASDTDHGVLGAIALAIPPSRHGELEARFGFPWREAYGSSESGPALAMPAEFAADFVGTGALGIPYPDVDARLVDPDGTEVVGEGTGELELSGAITFRGYLNNPAATAEATHDGWLRTGDLMRRDGRGVYYFVGRRKEVIRRSGVNIAPAEVEGVLCLHPDVVDAAVVPVPDPVMGEEIKAYVELADGASFRPGALAEFCARHLARQKVPRYIEWRRTPFPRTPTQRIPKNTLRVDGVHRIDSAWDRLEGAANPDAG